MLEVKVCSCCKVEKPLSEFGKDASKRDGLNSCCKRCRVNKNKEYRKANPERVIGVRRKYYKANSEKMREDSLKYKYKITLTEYNSMFAQQGGVCKICGMKETAIGHYSGEVKRLAVDHCHSTGVVRGLLCSRCNTAIGKMHDSPELLRKAADYIESFRT
ncbi:endonuclease VII [Pectobacterium phage Arno18]|uniref:Endonuclease VII n=1 Tax=Pectobacterium phage Arno18 TaxID=2500578 RepID=A0A678ZZK7_9CAUD|nr:endonuclease VII [Pectobacterium phage Arno18]